MSSTLSQHLSLIIVIKESSERAILHLRSLQTRYVAAVRRAGASAKSSPEKGSASTASSLSTPTQHPTTALFRSREILRPFLLTLDQSDSIPLVSSALEAVQLLIRGDAIQTNDGSLIAVALMKQSRECRAAIAAAGGVGGGGGALGLFHDRVLTLNQRAAKEDTSIAFRVLQSVTMLVDSRSIELNADVLGHCILCCLILGAGENPDEDGFSKGNNVKSAALATLNQVLSILFERARDVILGSTEVENNSVDRVLEYDESLILEVALVTLTDLSAIVHQSCGTSSSEKTTVIAGPFAEAMKEGLSLSPIRCLSLIDMIFKQRAIDLFRVCQRHFDENDVFEHERIDGSTGNNNFIKFAIQTIHQACQLVLSILQTQQSESSLSASDEVSSDAMAFSFFFYGTSLGSTILTSYLTPTSQQYYEKFDEMQLSVTRTLNSNNGDTMSTDASAIIRLLINFISSSTDAYHKSEFEDGYMFNQTERDSLNIGKDIGCADPTDEAVKNRRPTTQPTASHPTPDLLVANDQLWRTYLSLDVIYSLMCSHLEQIMLLDSCSSSDGSKSDDNVTMHKTSIGEIAKAASDFATISGSNRERILHVVIIAHEDTSAVGESSSAAGKLGEKFSDSSSARSGDMTACDSGLATWLSFKCVLALIQSLKRIVQLSKESEYSLQQQMHAHQILKEVFAPSVSVLQHYIKRISGSHVVLSQTLSAYEDLAYVSMALDSQEENLRRHAILTSLCKLCLPSWGKNRAHSQLKESNIDSIWVLLRIVHQQFDGIYDEWHAILSTFDQLARLSIKSSKLPVPYYKKASDIGGSLARLPKFTTCFSDEALLHFVTSLVSLSKVVSSAPVVELASDLMRQNSESFDYGDGKDDNANERTSISGKLISFAGRSLGFGGGSAQTTPNATLRRSHSVDSAGSQFSKVYSDDLREEACMLMMKMKISTPRSTIRKLPLPLLLLCIVVEANSHRLKVVEEALALHLCDIVAESTASEYRTFAMDILVHFIPVSLLVPSGNSTIPRNLIISAPSNLDTHKPLEILPSQQHSDAKGESQTNNDVNLLKILCETIEQTQQPETAEIGLNALHIVLEGTCQRLSENNLVGVIKTLADLSGHAKFDNAANSIDRSSKLWANISTKSFQTFKLIFDNFLEPSDPKTLELRSDSAEEQESIVECCVSFGKSRHDVNTSLTATGMLWTLADQNPTPDTLNLVLSKLSNLALDDRPELRNCAVNTLISCAVGRGDQFTTDQWERVLNETIFGVMKEVSGAINGSGHHTIKSSENDNSPRYKVAVHHSRDSITKQWSTTLVLTLRGLERVLRLFFPQLLASTSSKENYNEEHPWFLFTWTEVLRFSLESATLSGGRETLDIRLAGVELITLCAQLSCKSGMTALANSARVSTNMEVVGGALRSVRAAAVPDDETQTNSATPLEPEIEKWRERIFDMAFSSVVVNFRQHLKCSIDTAESSDHYMIDSVSTQVLNKLAGELNKLYECCKIHELQPGSCELRLDMFAEDDGSNESRFINLLMTMVEKCPSESSRFLNQVQKGVITLLQNMASNSSLRAFKALTSLSGDRIFV